MGGNSLIGCSIPGPPQSLLPWYFSLKSFLLPAAEEKSFWWCCPTCHVRVVPAPRPSYLHNAVLVQRCPLQDALDAVPRVVDIKEVPPVVAVLFDLRVIGLPKQRASLARELVCTRSGTYTKHQQYFGAELSIFGVRPTELCQKMPSDFTKGGMGAVALRCDILLITAVSQVYTLR